MRDQMTSNRDSGTASDNAHWLRRLVRPLALILRCASRNPLLSWTHSNEDKLDTPNAQPACAPLASPSAQQDAPASVLSQNKMGRKDACHAAPDIAHATCATCGGVVCKRVNKLGTRWCKTVGTITGWFFVYPATVLSCQKLNLHTVQEVLCLAAILLTITMSLTILVASGLTLLCLEWNHSCVCKWPNEKS